MKKTLYLLPFVLCSLSVFGYPAKVVDIADGDTCTVLTAENTQIKIRLGGIDSPEKTQAFGSKAKQALADKAFGQIIEVKEQSKDRYGRTVADLYLGERWINLEMVQDGFAWHYKAYSQDQKLAEAEQAARLSKVGLWADKETVPPWEFRKADKKDAGTSTPTNTTTSATSQETVQTQSKEPVKTEYWLNTGSNVRHNSGCKNFKNTKNGRPCTKDEGKACGICGG